MKVIFRADGDTQTGLGHIMRSAGVLQIIQAYFECAFWTQNSNYFPHRDFDSPVEVKQLSYKNILEEAEAISSKVSGDTIVVLDGYKFDTSYQKILKKKGIKLICIDDILKYHFVADAVINHAGGIDRNSYSVEPYTKLLLGPAYALVKPLFYTAGRTERDLQNNKLLISLGGADPHNDTNKVLEKVIQRNCFDEVHVVLGAANENFEMLHQAFSNHSCTFYSNLDGKSMLDLMQQCSQAVLSPSTICYEYMTLGGTVYLYQIADNQTGIKNYFIKEQIAFSFDELGQVNESRLRSAINKQHQIFDHQSPKRLLQVFLEISNHHY